MNVGDNYKMIVVTKFGHMLETLRMLWYYESSENPKTMQTISRKEQESCKEECTSAQSKVEILGWIAEVLRVARESSSSRHCEPRSHYLWTGRPSHLPSKLARDVSRALFTAFLLSSETIRRTRPS